MYSDNVSVRIGTRYGLASPMHQPIHVEVLSAAMVAGIRRVVTPGEVKYYNPDDIVEEGVLAIQKSRELFL